jgi:hypothetical protein
MVTIENETLRVTVNEVGALLDFGVSQKEKHRDPYGKLMTPEQLALPRCRDVPVSSGWPNTP